MRIDLRRPAAGLIVRGRSHAIAERSRTVSTTALARQSMLHWLTAAASQRFVMKQQEVDHTIINADARQISLGPCLSCAWTPYRPAGPAPSGLCGSGDPTLSPHAVERPARPDRSCEAVLATGVASRLYNERLSLLRIHHEPAPGRLGLVTGGRRGAYRSTTHIRSTGGTGVLKGLRLLKKNDMKRSVFLLEKARFTDLKRICD